VSFVSASPAIVRSVLQRNLLNTWLRLQGRNSGLPAFTEFSFDRLDDKLPDLVYYDVKPGDDELPSFVVTHQGSRLAEIFGVIPAGQDLKQNLRPHHTKALMPAYYECLLKCRPIYCAFDLPDLNGRPVSYERLMLPFGSGLDVNFVLASVKAISPDGSFVRDSLMRPQSAIVAQVRAVIDSGLPLSRLEKQLDSDVIEL
jgi:hypothetical protein